MKSVNGGIFKNSVLNAAAGMALLVTGFLSSVVVARLLGPEANGAIAFSLWLVATGSLIAELGTGVSLLRLLPQLAARRYNDAQRRSFAAYLAWPVVGSTLVFTAIYSGLAMLSPNLHWLDSAPHLVMITGILFVLQSIGSFSKNYLVGEQKLGQFLRLSTASGVLQLGGVAIGAWKYGITGALVGYALGQIVFFVSTAAILTSRPDKCGLSMRQVANSSFIVIIEFVITAIFLSRPEIVFLQQFQGIEAVGFYAVALSLANLALQLPIQLTGSLLTYYAAHVETNEGTLPAGIFETVVRSFAYLTLPMSFGLAAIADPLVVGVYGHAFHQAGIIVAILAVGAPASVFLQLGTQYIFSIDKPAIRLKVASIGAVAMGIGLLAVVPFFGGEGAAIIRNVVLLGMGIYLMRFIRRSGPASSVAPALIRVTLASLVMAAVAYAVTRYVSGLPGVGCGIIAGVVVYIPCLRIFKAIDPRDLAGLTAISARFPARLRPFYTLFLKIAATQAQNTARPSAR